MLSGFAWKWDDGVSKTLEEIAKGIPSRGEVITDKDEIARLLMMWELVN